VHAARALQLTSDNRRRALARALERIVEEEDEPRIALGTVVRPPPASIREARPLMLTLASRLHGREPVDPRGVAALKALLTDGCGALYSDGHPEVLVRVLRRIEKRLDAER
jgi:hypothetical protein